MHEIPDMKFRHFTVKEICQKADEINKERIGNKKKPLKSLVNLLNNIDRLKMNFQLVNLREPMINDEVRTELDNIDSPLSLEDRGSKNLIKMMKEDEFLTVYGSTFVQYVEPFYTVIMCERDLYQRSISKKK